MAGRAERPSSGKLLKVYGVDQAMEGSLKKIGERLQRMFGDPLRRPAGWYLIDAFARLEEREAALREGDRKTERDNGTPPENQNRGHPEKKD